MSEFFDKGLISNVSPLRFKDTFSMDIYKSGFLK